jgi:L-lactate dehydrogenase complex protein LldG
MTTKEEFLARIKTPNELYAMPTFELKTTTYSDLIAQFTAISSAVGGKAVELKTGEDINTLIASLHPEAQRIASDIPRITLANIDPDAADDPHQLAHIDLSIIQGEIGVAENGCVWIPQRERQKVIYFIAEDLIILLDKNKLVATMHEAYPIVAQSDYGFGVFISGPSKTADIEQALVVGAHGARSVTVVLI